MKTYFFTLSDFLANKIYKANGLQCIFLWMIEIEITSCVPKERRNASDKTYRNYIWCRMMVFPALPAFFSGQFWSSVFCFGFSSHLMCDLVSCQSFSLSFVMLSASMWSACWLSVDDEFAPRCCWRRHFILLRRLPLMKAPWKLPCGWIGQIACVCPL